MANTGVVVGVRTGVCSYKIVASRKTLASESGVGFGPLSNLTKYYARSRCPITEHLRWWWPSLNTLIQSKL